MGFQIKNIKYQKKALYKKNLEINQNDKYFRLFNIIYDKES